MQLLYVANRHEYKERIVRDLAAGVMVVCDRYLASSVAYGEAQGLDPDWLLSIQRFLPRPDVTFLLDIGPDVAARRKTADRDRFERDLALLGRVRDSYHRLAANGWVTLDASQSRDDVAWPPPWTPRSRDVRSRAPRARRGDADDRSPRAPG
jgi:dTMP kinase